MPYSPSRDTCSLFPSRFPFHFIRIDRSTFPRRHGKQTERDGRTTDRRSLARSLDPVVAVATVLSGLGKGREEEGEGWWLCCS